MQVKQDLQPELDNPEAMRYLSMSQTRNRPDHRLP